MYMYEWPIPLTGLSRHLVIGKGLRQAVEVLLVLYGVCRSREKVHGQIPLLSVQHYVVDRAAELAMRLHEVLEYDMLGTAEPLSVNTSHVIEISHRIVGLYIVMRVGCVPAAGATDDIGKVLSRRIYVIDRWRQIFASIIIHTAAIIIHSTAVGRAVHSYN